MGWVSEMEAIAPGRVFLIPMDSVVCRENDVPIYRTVAGRGLSAAMGVAVLFFFARAEECGPEDLGPRIASEPVWDRPFPNAATVTFPSAV